MPSSEYSVLDMYGEPLKPQDLDTGDPDAEWEDTDSPTAKPSDVRTSYGKCRLIGICCRNICLACACQRATKMFRPKHYVDRVVFII